MSNPEISSPTAAEAINVGQVTLGVSGIYVELAQRAAERMRKMTGLPTHIIGQDQLPLDRYEHPCWGLADLFDWLPQYTHLLYFDADVIGCRPWTPKAFVEWRPDSVWAVPDHGFIAERERTRLNTPSYINTGLMILPRQHADIYKMTLAHHPKLLWCHNQAAWNLVLHSTRTPIHFLRQAYNRLWPHDTEFDPAAICGGDTINAHLFSMSHNPELRLTWQRECLAWLEQKEQHEHHSTEP